MREILQQGYVPRTIVCPVDVSESERGGLRAAAALTDKCGAELHVIHVLDSPPPPPVAPGQRMFPDLDQHWEVLRATATERLRRAAREATRDLDIEPTLEVLLGVRYKEIAEYAEKGGADLIVMGSHGREGLPQKILGSVAERVIRLAGCPVLTVPPVATGLEPRRVLFATDFSGCADRALPAVRFFAETYGAQIFVVHVLPPRNGPAMMPETGAPPTMTNAYWETLQETAEADLQARADLLGGDGAPATLPPPITKIVEGRDPGAEILAMAGEQGIDLVITATRGNTGLTRLLLGSTAERIVRQAGCSVMTVTPDFFEAQNVGEQRPLRAASG